MDPKRTVLVVEDDSNDAMLLQRAFRRAQVSHPLRIVSDGEQAIAYLSGHAPYADRAEHPLPSVILLDLKLPRKSGLEVLEWIRRQPIDISQIPVIILTSSRHTVDIDQAYAMGASSYMAKPAGNFDGLAGMIKDLEKTPGNSAS